jgi:hypothetical protein
MARKSKSTARALRARIAFTGVNVLVLVCALLALAPSPAAHATNWYGATNYAATCPFNGNMTDNKSVVFSYIDASADLASASNWVRAELLNPTQLETSYQPNETTSTDVIIRDRYYTDWCESTLGVQWTTNGSVGLMGLTACYNVTANGRCDRQVARMSSNFFDTHNDPGDRWLVCHEVGHAIGLIHRNTGQGCMLNSGGIGDRAYTAHDLGHINGTW